MGLVTSLRGVMPPSISPRESPRRRSFIETNKAHHRILSKWPDVMALLRLVALLFGVAVLSNAPLKALALDNGVGKLPYLGYNTWNAYHCDINETVLRQTADNMVKLGLRDVGYQFLNIDDCWAANNRSADGALVANATRFPSGLKNLTDHIHDLGLKAGIYSDSGWFTCQLLPGSYQNEARDARQFQDWGFELLKYDNCAVPFDEVIKEGIVGKYSRMAGAIADLAAETGQPPLLYSICEWGREQPWLWGRRYGQAWRTTEDIDSTWKALAHLINNASFVSWATDFYGHNDMDILEVGNGDLTFDEVKSHFTAWALMKSPILIGTDLSVISEEHLSILKNTEILAINQDPVVGTAITPFRWGLNPQWTFDTAHPAQYWSGESQNGTVFMLLNVLDESADMHFNLTESPWIRAGRQYSVRDLWAHTDNGTAVRTFTAKNVPPHGVVALLMTDAGDEPAGTQPPCQRPEWCMDQNGTRIDNINFQVPAASRGKKESIHIKRSGGGSSSDFLPPLSCHRYRQQRARIFSRFPPGFLFFSMSQMSTSSIYNHSRLQPTGPPPVAGGPHSVSRLNESFEAIRQEFEVGSQVNELNIIRQSLYELEAQHGKVRQQYEEELVRLRAEVHALRQGLPPGPHTNVVGPASGGPQSAMSGTGGVPPFNDPYFRDRDREREQRDRERERDRGRERERERERDLEPIRDRDRDRAVDGRDPKRLKQDRIKPDHNMFSPTTVPKLPPPSSGGPPPMGPGGPPSTSGPGLPPPPSAHAPYPTAGPSSAVTSPMMDPHANPSGALIPINTPTGGFPEDLDLNSMPPEFKKEGSDWFAMFNPKVKRSLDVSLVHTLMHESVVCCVRFSSDGKYLATGCNRTAQIYDTKTGQKTCVLLDESAPKAGDLYIRSVCFSPDGKFLATGAEDKQIRIWDIQKKRIRNIFDGHQQEIYSLDFSQDGRLIVSGSGDKTARIWDMHDGTSKVLTINDPDSLNNDAGVTSVAISPNGNFVAAGSLDTVVRIWDVASGVLVERLRGHRDSVYSVAFTPDGKGLVSGSLDKTLKYWDVSALMAVAPGMIKGRKEGANGSVNGPGVAGGVVRKDGEKASQCTMNFTGHKDYVLSVAVSHDGQWVVSGSKDRGVQFWDSRTAIVQCMLQGHKNSVISIDLSPSGSILATGSGDWQARIWSYNTV
ncbi:hypothetical protein D9758_003601 [Tetrapyrgos nigripes]|uniref:Alpha-galactosidase n=1 Tax=Tetrapyrgos nigripes TaxID=182062 RepID=A0A8H5GVG9_9AGAR|nr:hypothetical protein D9758_003601 [Tetrapyrgos nigripes]